MLRRNLFPALLIAVGPCIAFAAERAVSPQEGIEVAGEGPLQLSVEQAVALALQHNPELAAEQQAPVIAASFEDVERARFDPAIFGRVGASRVLSQQQFDNTNETLDITNERQNLALGLRQRLPTGTELELEIGQERSESSRAPTQARAEVGVTVTQALLRGFGLENNLVALRQARSDVAASAYQLRGFVSALVAEVEALYWDYVGARERIRILEASKALAEREVEATRTRIEVGAQPRTELAAVRAEAARRQQELIDGRARAEQLQADLLRRLTPPGAPPWQRDLHAETQPERDTDVRPDIAEHVALAEQRRADLNEARLQLVRDELEVVATRNGLLPRLDLFITLGQTGFADSFGDAWRRVEDRDTYNLSAALEFEYPLGNRAARAEDRRAGARKRQAEEALRNLEGLVRAEVAKAVREVERASAQIEASAVTLALQEQSLEAEQARFEVGRSTALLVAQAQRDLLEAQLDRADAFIAYRKALIELYRLDGSLLTRRMVRAPGEGPPAGM